MTVASPCIEWSGARMKNGYGTVHGGKNKRLAHRAAYEAAFGPIPQGLFVCHRCDNPGCVNPQHLFLGTAKENAQDAVAKGRTCRGERHKSFRFEVGLLERVKALRAAGHTFTEVAEITGVSRAHACNVLRGNRRVYDGPKY